MVKPIRRNIEQFEKKRQSISTMTGKVRKRSIKKWMQNKRGVTTMKSMNALEHNVTKHEKTALITGITGQDGSYMES